jgi:hypothetical protein
MSYSVRASFLLLAACFVSAAAPNKASAQVPIGGPGGGAPQYRPAFSPYLNLLRQGSSPAVNYYGLVRPEINFYNSINQINQQVSNNQQAIGDIQSSAIPTTGHRVQFLNTGSYFQSMGGGTGAQLGSLSSSRTLQNAPALGTNTLGGGLSPVPSSRR